MKDVKFYQLEGKNVLALLSGSVEGAEPIAVGSVDAAKEKHIPVVKRVGDTLEVTVGSVTHPMLEEHHIEWIALATDDKLEIKFLKPGEEPKAVFAAVDSGVVYESCNLHGIWKAEFYWMKKGACRATTSPFFSPVAVRRPQARAHRLE